MSDKKPKENGNINLTIYVLGIVLGGSIFIPFTIRYISDAHFNLIFGAWTNREDVLNFLGIIIGAFVTILGIILTLNHNRELVKKQIEEAQKVNEAVIKDNQERSEKDRRLSVLPIITIEEVFDDLSDSANEEYIKELILYFEKGAINYLPRLTDKHIEIINSLTEIKEDEEGIFIVNQKGFCRQFSFTNSGIGTAVNLIITLYGDYFNTKVTLNNYPVINLKPMQSIKFIIFSDEIESMQDLYFIEFDYSDIYSNHYEQEHEFSISKDFIITGMQFEVNQKLK